VKSKGSMRRGWRKSGSTTTTESTVKLRPNATEMSDEHPTRVPESRVGSRPTMVDSPTSIGSAYRRHDLARVISTAAKIVAPLPGHPAAPRDNRSNFQRLPTTVCWQRAPCLPVKTLKSAGLIAAHAPGVQVDHRGRLHGDCSTAILNINFAVMRFSSGAALALQQGVTRFLELLQPIFPVEKAW